MRLRTSLASLVTVAALGAAPLALADPLDSDPSFGGDGVVKAGRGEGTITAIAEAGHRIYAAGGWFAGGSGEYNLRVSVRGRMGRPIRDQYGSLEMTSAPPDVADVLRWHHRVFAVAWLANGYNWVDDKTIPDYGFVAAFRGSLRGHLRWGTEHYSYWSEPDPGPPGLERLREVDFGTVTGGAIDSEGRVLVTGRVDGQTAVLRLTRDGHIDHSYGTNGLATVNVGSGSSPRDIAVHGTTALVVGNATINGHKQGFATQITGYGYRNRTFSGDGIRLIGKPGSYVTAVDTADAGRWLVASQRRHRAGVTKLDTTGELVTTFGGGGRATVRCTRPEDRNVIDALAVDRKDGALNQITLALTCKRNGDLRRLTAIWRPGGHPITSLKPDGVGRLPWHAPTTDITYGWRGHLIALVPHNRLIRLH